MATNFDNLFKRKEERKKKKIVKSDPFQAKPIYLNERKKECLFPLFSLLLISVHWFGLLCVGYSCNYIQNKYYADHLGKKR